MRGVGAFGDNDPDYRGEAYVAERAATASDRLVDARTRSRCDVEGHSPATTSCSTRTGTRAGRPTARRPSRTRTPWRPSRPRRAQTVLFRYRPRSFAWGLVASASDAGGHRVRADPRARAREERMTMRRAHWPSRHVGSAGARRRLRGRAARRALARHPRPSAPAPALRRRRARDRPLPDARRGARVVPLEHAALLFGWQGKAIYVDPIPPAINDATLPEADAILVTDAHYDHLDPVILSRVRPPRADRRRTRGGGRARADRRPHARRRDARRSRRRASRPCPRTTSRADPRPAFATTSAGGLTGTSSTSAGCDVYVSGDTDCTPEVRGARADRRRVPRHERPLRDDARGGHRACAGGLPPEGRLPVRLPPCGPLEARPRGLPRAGIEIRRRNFYPRAEKLRQQAYDGLRTACGASPTTASTKRSDIDPEGDADWRVVMTRRWLREYESPWPW